MSERKRRRAGGRRERSARWCRLSTGRLAVERGAGGGARLGPSRAASLNWCFRSRNVSAFGTCFVPPFPHTTGLRGGLSPRRSPEDTEKEEEEEEKTKTAHVQYEVSRGHFHLMFQSAAFVWTSEMEHVHTFVSFTLTLSSSGYGSSPPSRRADLSADGVDYTLLPVETVGTVSAPYTTTGLPDCAPLYKLALLSPQAWYHILPLSQTAIKDFVRVVAL